MPESLEKFLGQVATRGSWVGGGSVTALSAALAAALLEKLTLDPHAIRRLRRSRRACVRLIRQDAETFARAIRATRSRNGQVFRRALKAATAVQEQGFHHACAVQAASRQARQTVKPRFQSDLRCALKLATAARESAGILIHTNLAWLDEKAYVSTVRRKLRRAARH